MNKSRRKVIEQATALIQQSLDLLQSVKDEEQESFDNLPEGLQSSEKGETMEFNIGALEDSCANLESAIVELENIE